MLECGFGGHLGRHLEFKYDKVIKKMANIEFCPLNSAYKFMFANFNMNCTRKPCFGHKHIGGLHYSMKYRIYQISHYKTEAVQYIYKVMYNCI